MLGGVPILEPLATESVRDWLAQGGPILDVRPTHAFAECHIPGAYGISLDAPIITWAGWLIPFGTPLVLVSQGPADLENAVRQLTRIGYDDLRGYLRCGCPSTARSSYTASTGIAQRNLTRPSRSGGLSASPSSTRITNFLSQ